MPQRGSEEAISAEIAVIGGGPAGLLAATRLAETGRRVALVAPEAPPDSRTTALLGASVDALRRAGVWDDVAPTAQPLKAIRIVDATERLVRAPEVLFRADEVGLEAFGYNTPNSALLEALTEQATSRGVSRVRAAAREITFGTDEASTRLESGGLVSAELVVACDGQRSATRAAASIDIKVSETGQSAIAATLSHPLPHEDISTEFHAEHGPFTLVPLPGDRSALVWVTSSEQAATLAALPPAKFSRRATAVSRHLLGELSLDGRAQVFPLRSAIAERLAARRLVLVGEAGHALPPIGAQGFNLTVRDIETLVRLVDGASADCGALPLTEAYHRGRRADIISRKVGVDTINRSLLSGFLPTQLARGAGLFAMARFSPIRRFAMRVGLGVSP